MVPLCLMASLIAFAGCDSGGSVPTTPALVTWSYSGPGGPANWAFLSEENSICATSLQQSPIDIAGYDKPDADLISFSYGNDDIAVRNDGRQVHVDYPEGNTLSIGQRTFKLKSAHFHAPSEHLIDGTSFAAELHLVHAHADSDLAVVGVLFTLGEPSATVQAILDAAPATGEGGTPETALNAKGYVPQDLSYYHYDGSKTTPPCDEPVSWFVMREPRTISEQQVRRLQKLSDGPNNRPVQPAGDRLLNALRLRKPA